MKEKWLFWEWASIEPALNNQIIWLKIGKLISPFWLTKYRILNAFEFDQKVKQPSESVNPDNHPSDKLGRIVDWIGVITDTWILPLLALEL